MPLGSSLAGSDFLQSSNAICQPITGVDGDLPSTNR